MYEYRKRTGDRTVHGRAPVCALYLIQEHHGQESQRDPVNKDPGFVHTPTPLGSARGLRRLEGTRPTLGNTPPEVEGANQPNSPPERAQ